MEYATEYLTGTPWWLRSPYYTTREPTRTLFYQTYTTIPFSYLSFGGEAIESAQGCVSEDEIERIPDEEFDAALADLLFNEQ